MNGKKKKRKTDPVFRIKKNIRDRIRKYMNGKSLSQRTFDIIGLSRTEFIQYIESQFTEGMSWDNYGEWHIDHIIPLNYAKTEDKVLELNYYKNLRPLWAEENLKRNRKYGN